MKPRRGINKSDIINFNTKYIDILHWNYIQHYYTLVFGVNYQLYIVGTNLDNMPKNWYPNSKSEDFNYLDFINSNLNRILPTDIESLIKSDLIMSSLDSFKERLDPYIRNQKINNIINGN